MFLLLGVRLHRGLWNVAFIANMYLIHGNVLHAPHTPSFDLGDLDPDMAFCKNLRDRVSNSLLS